MGIKDIIKKTIENLEFSYAPYSNFHVSAILETEEGKLYQGVNLENASYPVGICAERSAFASALSKGERNFKRLVLVGAKKGESPEIISPCGMCRQFMREFCEDDFELVFAKSPDEYKVYTFKDILPLSFSKEDLDEHN